MILGQRVRSHINTNMNTSVIRDFIKSLRSTLIYHAEMDRTSSKQATMISCDIVDTGCDVLADEQVLTQRHRPVVNQVTIRL